LPQQQYRRSLDGSVVLTGPSADPDVKKQVGAGESKEQQDASEGGNSTDGGATTNSEADSSDDDGQPKTTRRPRVPRSERKAKPSELVQYETRTKNFFDLLEDADS
jgi:hypothetical protein